MLYMTLGTQEELRDQIIDCALGQACLAEPWPVNQQQFEARRADGKDGWACWPRKWRGWPARC